MLANDVERDAEPEPRAHADALAGEARVEDAASSLGDQLGLDAEMAEKLFRAGGATAELVAQMPAEYIAGQLGISEEEAQVLLSKVNPAKE